MRVGVVTPLVACVALMLSLPAEAFGRQDRRRAQVQAAQGDAVASIVDQVCVAPLTPDITVGQFLETTGGEDRLRRAIEENAELIGATRWPNPETCQVHLEVAGGELVQTLVEVARHQGDKSPVPAAVLGKRLEASWKGRTFSATGTSATPEAVERMRPGSENPIWLSVPEEERREAVRAAQRSAARRTMDGLNDIRLGDGKTLSDAMQVAAVRDALQGWVAKRPVTNIEFRDNGEVRLTVSAPGEELWLVLKDALAKQNEVPAPRDEAEWQRLRDDVVRRLRSPVGGRSTVTIDRRVELRPRVRVALPQQPPKWAGQDLNADGQAAAGAAAGGRLRLSHQARGEAIKDLRRQIEALPLGEGRTLGEAAAEDPEIAAAIDRSLLRARPHKVDWGDNGKSVSVRVGLDLRHLWQELHAR